jgi:hypothetical protein
MTTDRKDNNGANDAGYRKPPKEHQFKKGVSGNPAGRPPKRKRNSIDVTAILNEPILVTKSGVRRKMPAFEASSRKLVARGLNDNKLDAILEFIALCETYNVLKPPSVDHGGGVITAPRGMTPSEWLDSVAEWAPATSPDDDDDDDDF